MKVEIEVPDGYKVKVVKIKRALTESEKLKHCSGCHDNFYNQQGNSSTGRCWALAKMKLIMRKEVSIDQRPPWNQSAELLPDCYHKPRFVYVKPDQTC